MTDARDGSSRWRTFGERTIYDNPWVWLGQIDVELVPPGNSIVALTCLFACGAGVMMVG